VELQNLDFSANENDAGGILSWWRQRSTMNRWRLEHIEKLFIVQRKAINYFLHKEALEFFQESSTKKKKLS